LSTSSPASQYPKKSSIFSITGHQSFLTNEALSGIANTTIANLDAWHKGEAAKNEL
jgi:lactate dehydrogenase-like 2-hydroxyacid dehydrogenase